MNTVKKVKEHSEKMLAEVKLLIAVLEAEWDRLDSHGTQTERQRVISEKLASLGSTKNFLEEFLQRGKK